MRFDMIKDSKTTVEDLVERKICPAWWVPSNSMLKRCIPSFTQTSDKEEVDNSTVIIEAGETPRNDKVTGGVLR